MKGHDEAIARLRQAAVQVTLRQASDAFLASLSARNLDWRVVLPAVVMARHLPDHGYVKQTVYSSSDNCGVCGFNELEEQYGVSPGRLAGQIEALGTERPRPSRQDIEIFNGILAAAAEQRRLAVDGRVRRAELAKSLGKLFRSNKYERMDLLDALGRCSVLAPDGEGFLRSFVHWNDRSQGSGNNEFEYPFALWEARMGPDMEALREVFPQEGIVYEPPAAPPPLDEAKARKELEKRSARARGGDDAIAEVLYAPGGLWIARLTDGRYAIYYKLARRWRWETGPRDAVLALVPEAIFAEAVEAVVAGASEG